MRTSKKHTYVVTLVIVVYRKRHGTPVPTPAQPSHALARPQAWRHLPSHASQHRHCTHWHRDPSHSNPPASVTGDSGAEAAHITLFDACAPAVPKAIDTIQVSHGYVVTEKCDRLPLHLSRLLEIGTPVLLYGRPGDVSHVRGQALQHRPQLQSRDLTVYVRPKVPFESGPYAYTNHAACAIAPDGVLKGQVCAPNPSVWQSNPHQTYQRRPPHSLVRKA